MQKLIPPYLVALLILAMVLSRWMFQELSPMLSPLYIIGGSLSLCGLLVAGWHNALFHRRQTNIWTFSDPDKLIIESLFKLSRNPMYLGFLLVLMGVALILGLNWVSISCILVYWFLTNYWYIPFEEHRMQEKFGQQYLDYCKQTRRWL